MELAVTAHGYVAYAVLAGAAALALVAGFYFLTRRRPSTPLLAVAGVAETLVVLQVVLGAELWLPGLRAANDFHYLYGLVGPLVIPAFYVTGRRDARLLPLWLLLAALVILGMGFRSFSTAGHPLIPGL